MAIERRLTELIGPLGGKMHTGRSRNDQVILDLHLYLRDAIPGHRRRVVQLMGALAAQGERHKDVVMPGYTHMQRAQPVSVAHHLLAYFFALERDWQRLDDWKRCSWMPLGAGALAGVNYPLDREQVAAELGLRAGGSERHGRGRRPRCRLLVPRDRGRVRPDAVAAGR